MPTDLEDALQRAAKLQRITPTPSGSNVLVPVRSTPSATKSSSVSSDLDDALARASRVQGTTLGVSSSRELSPSPGIIERVKGVGSSIGKVVGHSVEDVFHGLAYPQRLFLVGPARAAIKGGWHVPSLAAATKAGLEAAQTNTGFTQVAKDLGWTGLKAMLAGAIGDIFADPLWVLKPVTIARALKIPEMIKALDASRAGRAVMESRGVKAVGKALVTDYGLPKEFAGFMQDRHVAIMNATHDIMDVANAVQKLPVAEQALITRYLEVGSRAGREAILHEATAKGLNADRIGELGYRAMMGENKWGRALVDAGKMKESTFQKMQGKHLHREFLRHEDPYAYLDELAKRNPEAAAKLEASLKAEGTFRGETYAIRERRGILKTRKDVSPEVMQEIHALTGAEGLAHRIASGQREAATLAATATFFKRTMETFGKSIDQEFAGQVARLRKIADPASRAAAKAELEVAKGARVQELLDQGYKYMGEDRGLGALRRAYVPAEIAEVLNKTIKQPGKFMRMLQAGVGVWKYGKTILNPAFWVKKTVADLVLADMAGVHLWKPYRYVEAFNELRTQGKYYKEAREAGSFLTDVFGISTEIRGMLPKDVTKDEKGVRRLLEAAARLLRKPNEWFQLDQQLFKMAVFIDKRKAGIAPKLAAELADKYLFNYRRLPEFVDSVRRSGIVPFIAFPYKTTPILVESLLHRPASISKYGKAFDAVTKTGTGDPEQQKKVLPKYLQKDWMLRLPSKDAKGNTYWIDLERFWPFAHVLEATGAEGFTRQTLAASPYYQLATALGTGQDPLTKRQIDTMPGGMTRWLWNFTAPALVGYPAQRMAAAVRGRTVDPLSRRDPESLGQAIPGALTGATPRAYDLNLERANRVREWVREQNASKMMIRRLAQAHAAKNITDEEYAARVQEEVNHIRNVADEIIKLGRLELE